jgi:hypothetical protein
MRPKLQKRSELTLAGRIIPQSGGYNTPKRAFESVSKACLGVNTRDKWKINYFGDTTGNNGIIQIYQCCPMGKEKQEIWVKSQGSSIQKFARCFQ